MKSRQLFLVTASDHVSMQVDGSDVILRIGTLQITMPRDRMDELTRPRESTACQDCGSLSEALKAARLANGLSLAAVADELDVSVNSLWRWENAVYRPWRSTLYHLAALYKLSYESLTILAERA